MNNIRDLIYSTKYKLNIYRRYRYWSKEHCIFIHVPKVAGTSINRALYGKTLGHYKAFEIKHAFPLFFTKSFKFSFVRNPWDRTLSAYKFAKMGRTESMGVRNAEQYKIPEFDSFEKFVTQWLPNQKLEELDFIFQPQYYFLYDDKDELLVDFTGKLEYLDEDIKQLETKLNRQLNISHENKTSGGKNYRDDYRTPEMIQIIRNIYEKDIELFGYEF